MGLLHSLAVGRVFQTQLHHQNAIFPSPFAAHCTNAIAFATSYARNHASTSLSNNAALDYSRHSRLALAMPRLKRSATEAQLDVPTEPEMAPEAAQTLKDLRNMWEFASLMQYIFLFGNVVKIDEDFDIEV